MVDLDTHLDHSLDTGGGTSTIDADDDLLGLLPRVRSFFRRRALAVDVEDLTQEVYLHMLGRSSRVTIQNLRGYLLTVAANVLSKKARGDRIRIHLAHVEFHERGNAREHNTPERIVLHRELVQRMLTVIEELPPRTRDVFVLHRFEDMTYEDIARQMCMSASGVEKHMMKAMRHLTMRRKDTET